MARKRINYKVLYGVLGGFVVTGGLVFLAAKTMQHESPSSYADLGDVYMSEHKWADAIQAYTKAIRLSNAGNPDYLTRRGRAIRMETPFEPDLIGKDRADWDRALEVDPKYMPALTAELNFYVEYVQLEPSASAFAKMREMAERIEAIDPTQLRAVAYGPIAVLQSWIGGVQQDETTIDQAIDKLTGLLGKETALAASQPAVATAKPYQIDPEIPFWIAMGRWKRAVVALQTGKPALAQDNVDQAAALFDKLMKEQDQNASLAYRAYTVYMQLARVDKANSKADLEKAKTALDRARALLDDKDPLFVEVNLAASEALLSRGDPAGSIQLLRDVLATHPNNAQVTLQLARRLALIPDKRKEAIDLLNKLSNTKISGEGSEGVRGVQMSGIRTQVNIELANLRINQYQTMKDPQQRAELLKQIEEQVTTLSQTNSESGAVQRLIGEVQMLKGQNVEAIQTFSHAVQTIERTGNMHDKADVKYRLAQAYIGASQTGPARETLKNLIYEMPNLPGPRFMMAQVCLREGDRDGALTQYSTLEADGSGQSGREAAGAGQLMDPNKQKERMDEEYARLPETSRTEKFQKAQAAIQLGRLDDAIKILQAMHDADPKDLDTTRFLSQWYNRQGNREQAMKVVNESLAAMPDDPQMKYMAAALGKNNMTPAEFDKARLDAINAIPSDRDRELSLAQYYIERGSRDDALVHFKKAEAAHPDDPEVLDRAFQFFVAGKQWDEAQKYLPKLTAINRDQANGKLFLFRFQFAKGDYDGALETAREVTRTLPEFAQSWLIYGQALQATGQFEQARSQYVQALAKQSNNIEALKGVITCDYKMGKPDDAHRYIQTARQAWPNDPTFKDLEAGWEMNYGDPEKVIPAREAALKANSERPENWGELGIAYMRTSFVKKQSGADGAAAAKEYAAKAWDTFIKAKEKWPDNKVFAAYIAELALTGNGDFAVAEDTLKQLTQRAAFKDKPDAWELLGVFYLRAGKADAAEAAMKQAVARSGKDDSTAASQYAAFLLGQRRYDEALAALEPIASVPGVLGRKVEILLQAGRFPAAEAARPERHQGASH